MPNKERIRKRKEKERQEAAKGSITLNAWLKPTPAETKEEVGPLTNSCLSFNQ